jgi:hypothetical protein
MKREAIVDLRAGSDGLGSVRAGRDVRQQSRPAACGAFAARASLFIAVLLASLLFAAVEVRFGVPPSEIDEITTM